MGLLQQTEQQYYDVKKSFTGDGTTTKFTVSNSNSTFPSSFNESNVDIYIDNVLIISNSYSFIFTAVDAWHIDFTIATGTAYGAPASDVVIVIDVSSDFGNYQYITLSDVINNFMISHVGQDKIISKTDRVDVIFHAKRALQELSYDTLKSIKSQEIEVPASLTMILPQDYVNYVKLTWKDSSGIEHIIYPTSKTSNPIAIKQDSDGNYSFDIDEDTTVNKSLRDDTSDLINPNNSDTWNSYKGTTPSENNTDDYQDDTYWPAGGERYGLDPQHAQTNGSFFIDEIKGLIHFSSNISGKTLILKYISDGLGQKVKCVTKWVGGVMMFNAETGVESITPGGWVTSCDKGAEPLLHKFAEEAAYKWIAYAVLATRSEVPEHLVQRFKKEKFTETRKAKLRLSNIKLEEITQILRGRSKQIKH